MPQQNVVNPTDAFGYTDLQTTLPATVDPFEAAGVQAAGPKVVAINTVGAIATAATNGTASLVVGVAINGASINTSGSVMVVTRGMAENVPCDGAVAAGDALKRSVTTAGSVATTATPGVGELLGYAINASSSNTVDVWVCKG